MKATGIVRRIDDLGRVVIPKEIRRTMRIREGDPLEIYTDADGEVIFKKYSPMGEMSEFTSQYAEVLYRATNMPVIITDRDHVISCTGLSKKDTIDRHITKELEDIMENRSSFVASADKKTLMPVEGLDRNAAIASFLARGGASMILAKGTSRLPGFVPSTRSLKTSTTGPLPAAVRS